MVTIFPQATVKNLATFGEYQLLSSHEKAMNLVNQFGHLVSLHPSVQYLSPFGMVFRQEDFEYLRSTCHPGETFTADNDNVIRIGRTQVAPSNRKIELKLFPSSGDSINSAIFSKFDQEINGFGLSNGEMLNQKSAPIDTVTEFLVSPNLNNARHVVKHIGLGLGLTPSFDDVLVGALAVLFWRERHQIYLRPLIDALAEINLDKQTTTVSKHFITHAMLGEFSYPLLKLLSSFKYDSKTIEYSIKQFIQHGHTSGRDTLLGLAIAFQHFDQ